LSSLTIPLLLPSILISLQFALLFVLPLSPLCLSNICTETADDRADCDVALGMPTLCTKLSSSKTADNGTSKTGTKALCGGVKIVLNLVLPAVLAITALTIPTAIIIVVVRAAAGA
jgi:hypothetical protein